MKKLVKKVQKIAKKILRFDKKTFPIFSVLFLGLIVVYFVWRHKANAPFNNAIIITSDVAAIVKVLKNIDESCSILSIKYERSRINFLNVEKFIGSEVGSLNLAYPKNWKGPYLKDNPTLQGKFYEMVHGRDGYFILPGDKVVLPNKKVMGVDVVVGKHVDINPMFQKDGALYYRDTALGVKVSFKVGDWPTSKTEIGSTFKEIKEAIPFT